MFLECVPNAENTLDPEAHAHKVTPNDVVTAVGTLWPCWMEATPRLRALDFNDRPLPPCARTSLAVVAPFS